MVVGKTWTIAGVLGLALAWAGPLVGPGPLVAVAHAQRGVSAQDEPGVTARLASDEIYIGDSVTLELAVQGDSDQKPPEIAATADYDVQYLGAENRSSTSITIINGRRVDNSTRGYAFQYRITPKRTGTFNIGPFTATVDGAPRRSNPVRLRVIPPASTSDYIVRLEADQSQAYVGQAVRVKATWLLGGRASNPNLTGIDPGGSDYLVRLPSDAPNLPPSNRGDSPYVALEVGGQTVAFEKANTQANGQTYFSLTGEFLVIPQHAGDMTVGPLSIAFDVPMGRYQGDPFFQREQTKRFVARSEPLTIAVRPLPERGKPRDFSGLVGTYSLAASAENASVSVGDPITVRLVIKGSDPLDRVMAPDLASLPGFRAFKLSPEGWTADTGELSTRAFKTTLRAQSAATTTIPPIALNFFNPQSGQYETASSQPIELSVKPTREVTAADAVVAGAAPARRAEILESAKPGIAANDVSPALLADEPPLDPATLLHSPTVIGAVVAPPLLFAAISLWAWRRRVTPGRLKKLRRARRAALARLKSEPDPAVAATCAICDFVALADGRVPGSYSTAEATEVIRNIDRAAADEVARLLGELDRARFGFEPAPVPDQRRAAAALVTSLYRRMRSSST